MNALKAWLGANEENWAPRTEEREARVTCVERDLQKKETEKKKSKNVSDDEYDSQNTFCLYCLGACSTSASREMWILCIACSLWTLEKGTESTSKFMYLNF